MLKWKSNAHFFYLREALSNPIDGWKGLIVRGERLETRMKGCWNLEKARGLRIKRFARSTMTKVTWSSFVETLHWNLRISPLKIHARFFFFSTYFYLPILLSFCLLITQCNVSREYSHCIYTIPWTYYYSCNSNIIYTLTISCKSLIKLNDHGQAKSTSKFSAWNS